MKINLYMLLLILSVYGSACDQKKLERFACAPVTDEQLEQIISRYPFFSPMLAYQIQSKKKQYEEKRKSETKENKDNETSSND